jgi:Dolichyl-phosphate-mannose-protein mannosyltransferase
MNPKQSACKDRKQSINSEATVLVETLTREKIEYARPIRSANRLSAAERAVLMIIVATMAVRILFASSLGLGIDESYTVATGRHLQLSYFDHPPLAWWLAWAGGHLFGVETPLALRAPFIALFALTTWLMFTLTRLLFGERAGLWAAVTLNFAPVIAWTSGTWILPDGPLNAALLAGAYCVAVVLFIPGPAAPLWWLAAGACGGLAMMAKLHGIFLFAGTALFLLTSRTHRHWLATPWPYLAVAVAAAIFMPAIIWNAEHKWVSFVFQAERANPRGFAPWAPLVTLAGQALFLLPWVWLPLILCLVRAGLAGPAQERQWLLACLAIGPIVVFTVVAWTGTRTLPHWAAPGYLMLFPLLGRQVAKGLETGRRHTRTWLSGTAVSMALVLGVVITLAYVPWPPLSLLKGVPVEDPLLATLDWNSLEGDLQARHLLGRPSLFIAATRWDDAAKIDYALHGKMPVLCLARDPRGYGILTRPKAHIGQDALIIGQSLRTPDIERIYGKYFKSLEELPSIAILQGRRPALNLSVYLAHALRDAPNGRNLLDPTALDP